VTGADDAAVTADAAVGDVNARPTETAAAARMAVVLTALLADRDMRFPLEGETDVGRCKTQSVV